jgi:hypothetical protein
LPADGTSSGTFLLNSNGMDVELHDTWMTYRCALCCMQRPGGGAALREACMSGGPARSVGGVGAALSGACRAVLPALAG